MIQRDLEKGLHDLASWYPIVSITGPRQSGKSTLVQAAFPNYAYINLEDPATLERARLDPSGFVAHLPERSIIDEAQYAPDIFPALQVKADQRNVNGQFILSGSQNFRLLSSIKESLAGRVGIAHLLPLSYYEISKTMYEIPVAQTMINGLYPGLYSNNIPPNIFYSNYIDTYITRDVLDLRDVRNDTEFRAFLKICASRVGNLINYSDLARDVGISSKTAKSWLSILESSYVIKQLPAYSPNISKRVAKSPKLYFYDTGLLCHLLDITSEDILYFSPYYGAVFENFIISEQLKKRYNVLKVPNLFFYRDDSKIEVDMIDLTETSEPTVCEIKSSQTFKQTFTRHVRAVIDASRLLNAYPAVIYGGEGIFKSNDTNIFGFREWLLLEPKPISVNTVYEGLLENDGERYRTDCTISDK